MHPDAPPPGPPGEPTARRRLDLSRLRLRFDDPALEREYRSDHHCRMLRDQGLALLAGAGLYAAFGVLDGLIAPASTTPLWIIRYVLVVPVLLVTAALFLWRPRLMHRGGQAVMTLMGIHAGVGIIAMTTIVPPPVDYLYYAGLILLVMFIYGWCRLSLGWASVAGLTVLVAYEVTATLISSMPWTAVVSNSFFLIASVVIGTGTSYTLAHQDRRRFLDLRTIAHDREELASLNLQLSELATHDHLTGLLNRRVLDERLQEALAAQRRYGTLATLLMIDLDGFKQINDQLGHTVGDDVLRAVADTLRREVRDTDLVFRYGGDEFCVLFQKVELEASMFVGNRILEALQQLRVESVPRELRIGFSGGCVAVGPTFESARDILNAADTLLYRAKQDGKGHVLTSDVAA